MKKRLWIILALVAVVSCVAVVACTTENNNQKVVNVKSVVQDNAQNYEVKSYVTSDIKKNSQDCKADLCLVEEFSPEKIGQDADSIALVTVISLDNSNPNGSLVGATEGRLMINNVLKGELENGQVINYTKPGGIMKMSDWEETQPEAANMKRKYLREKSGLDNDTENMYINLLISGDIEIEAGKSYLAYLKKNQNSQYEIIGLGNGLRELNVNQVSTVTANQLNNTSDLKIKNNETGEYESLQTYINTYINIDEKK